MVQFLKDKALDAELQPDDIEVDQQAGRNGRQLHSLPTSGASHCHRKRWSGVLLSSALHSFLTDDLDGNFGPQTREFQSAPRFIRFWEFPEPTTSTFEFVFQSAPRFIRF